MRITNVSLIHPDGNMNIFDQTWPAYRGVPRNLHPFKGFLFVGFHIANRNPDVMIPMIYDMLVASTNQRTLMSLKVLLVLWDYLLWSRTRKSRSKLHPTIYDCFSQCGYNKKDCEKVHKNALWKKSIWQVLRYFSVGRTRSLCLQPDRGVKQKQRVLNSRWKSWPDIMVSIQNPQSPWKWIFTSSNPICSSVTHPAEDR